MTKKCPTVNDINIRGPIIDLSPQQGGLLMTVTTELKIMDQTYRRDFPVFVDSYSKDFTKAQQAEKGDILEIRGAICPDFIFPESLVNMGLATGKGERIPHLNEATIQGIVRAIKGDYGIICVSIVSTYRDRQGVRHTEFKTSASQSLRVYRNIEQCKIGALVSVKGPVRHDGSIYPLLFRNVSLWVLEQLPSAMAVSARH